LKVLPSGVVSVSCSGSKVMDPAIDVAVT
jgi:hypothetical protein